mgnify:CR=1 FL=1|tara:strand:- start:3451 stop:4374 length:924 start_codon:yes stop_codon:yes gene_type:complete
MLKNNKNSGVAMITAMMIVAIVSLITINLLWENTLNTRKTISIINRDQAIQVAIGVESWVKELLIQDAKFSESDHLGEFWGRPLPNLPIDGGLIKGEIYDLQSNFNINNLIKQNGEIDQNQLKFFERILSNLNLKPIIANAIIDWIDSDQYTTYPDGAEDDIYMKLNPAYRTANQKMISVSELLAISSINLEIYETIKPYVTSIPGYSKINVNTASPLILRSLDKGISENQVKRLIEERRGTGYDDISVTFKPILNSDNLLNVTNKSDYFQLKLQVNIDNFSILMYSTIKRESQNSASTVYRSFGTI